MQLLSGTLGVNARIATLFGHALNSLKDTSTHPTAHPIVYTSPRQVLDSSYT